MNIAEVRAFLTRIHRLEVTAQEIKDTWQQFLDSEADIKAEFNAMTKKDLIKHCLMSSRMSDKKEELVNDAFQKLMALFTPGDISYNPMEENCEEAIARLVDTWTDELIEEKRNPKPKPAPVSIAPPPPPAPDTPNYVEIGEAWMQKNMPHGAKAAIVAELYKDESDSMTDYFAGFSTKMVVLAWSRHERDLFPEMRKAADLYEETKHLGTGKGEWRIVKKGNPEDEVYTGRLDTMFTLYTDTNSVSRWSTREEAEAVAQAVTSKDKEKLAALGVSEGRYIDGLYFGYEIEGSDRAIEKREKYAMGHGYYLGHSRYSGWQVSKTRLSWNRQEIAAAIGKGNHVLDKHPPTSQRSGRSYSAPLTEPDEPLELPPGVTLNIIPSHHAKKGIDIWVVQISERVDREIYNSLNTRAKQLGGYYSTFTRNGAIPGFIFTTEAAAKLFTGFKEPEAIEKEDKHIDGIDFIYGENETQIFWEAVVYSTKYVCLQTHNTSWWVIIAMDTNSDGVKTLNCKVCDDSDSLYVDRNVKTDGDLTVNEWLQKLADYINEGNDPFQEEEEEIPVVAVEVVV